MFNFDNSYVRELEGFYAFSEAEPMLAAFRSKIEQAGHKHIELHCGDAQILP